MTNTVETAELLLGAGHDHSKRFWFPDAGVPEDWTNLTTLDNFADGAPDILHDLNVFPYPFDDNSFDEVHAYEVMEHLGRVGDWRFFFNSFYELWRILKPGGFLIMTCPRWDSVWAWSDPGHTRLITPQMLTFLYRVSYDEVGETTRTNYLPYWHGDFEPFYIKLDDESMLAVLRASK